MRSRRLDSEPDVKHAGTREWFVTTIELYHAVGEVLGFTVLKSSVEE